MSRTSIEKSLNKMVDLSPNWDSYGARTINLYAVNLAKKLNDVLPDWEWQAVPCSDGGVQLEATRNGCDIEITVSPNA
jgi:hypothetical protein